MLISHLFKVYIMRDNESVNHWMDEIYSFCNDIPKLKGRNSFPKKEFIYKYLFGFMEDVFHQTYKRETANIEYKYGYECKYTEDELKEFIRLYIQWLSEKLSNVGSVSNPEVHYWIEDHL